MRTMVLLVFSLALPLPADASAQSTHITADSTLEAAIRLAGPSVAGLPIGLASVPPDRASSGIEAWMLRRHDGVAERIVVYTGSDVFRCASHRDRMDRRCLVKLASIIVHEAWHYRYGPDEAAAYDAQIAFLTVHGGSSEQITGVRLARDRVLGTRKGIKRDRR